MTSDTASATREARLRAALQALHPQRLEIADDSHRHRNHPGAADGRGHFKVVIVSEEFRGLSRLKRHQRVFECVGELMTTDVHALQIEAKTPEET